MILLHRARGCLVFLLTVISIFQLSLLNPIGLTDRDGSQKDTTPELLLSVDGKKTQPAPKPETKDKADDELFGDVDPQQLAAILVEALKSKDEDNTHSEESAKDELRDIRMVQRADKSRVMELLTQRQKQDCDQDQEEEKLTEKVTSRTTSQIVQVQTKQPSAEAEQKVGEWQNAEPQSEQEEQLTPEELQSLETMMKEFPRFSPFQKREDDLRISYNEISPANKNPDISKKKLKWQEETQKALNFPIFREGNFMDEFADVKSVADNTAWPDQVFEQEATENLQPEIEEEVLSPEEEEAQAKAEQDEMRRQAAEAQRAKMEEEKLADIASDMLLSYMSKESHRKYNWPVSDVAEDKRSDEQRVTHQDVIYPQTIDKLIEISSKLHLPADDVVDIISDVAKKKRKDVALDLSLLNPLLTSSNKLHTNKNSYSQIVSSTNRLKTWFHYKSADSQDLWSKPKKLKPTLLSTKQNAPESWLKPVVWTGQPSYPLPYPPYYQSRPYSAYYLHSPPPRHQLQYYTPKLFVFNNPHTFLPQPEFNPSWTPLRTPMPYYSNNPLLPYPWIFQLKFPPNRWVPLKKQFYMSASTPAVKKKAYKTSGKTNISSQQEDLKKYIQQMILKRAHKSL